MTLIIIYNARKGHPLVALVNQQWTEPLCGVDNDEQEDDKNDEVLLT